MKYIFLMGASGTGKTTLAKRLEKLDSKKFSRTRELSTREKRIGEVDGFDYIFITPEQFEKEKDTLFEKVEYQFNDKYGCRFENLYSDKWNVVIVCIEAFLSAVKNVKADDSVILINLISENPFVNRDGRSPLEEARLNKAVLNNFERNGRISINGKNNIIYEEIDPVKLTTDEELLETILKFIDKVPLYSKIKNAESLEDLLTIFKKHSVEITSSLLLDALNNKLCDFNYSVKDFVDLALKK